MNWTIILGTEVVSNMPRESHCFGILLLQKVYAYPQNAHFFFFPQQKSALLIVGNGIWPLLIVVNGIWPPVKCVGVHGAYHLATSPLAELLQTCKCKIISIFCQPNYSRGVTGELTSLPHHRHSACSVNLETTCNLINIQTQAISFATLILIARALGLTLCSKQLHLQPTLFLQLKLGFCFLFKVLVFLTR